ncbi:MAG: GNAT family N-acetyltransferase [Firmicutes bacterium]|nr:GNAT family N-acetyltransferase [Bacillota bacterium]
MIIETERLILRPFNVDDAEAMYKNWASDPDVLRYMPYNVCETLEAARSCAEGWLESIKNMEGAWQVWAIQLKPADEIIGTIDFVEVDTDARSAEVGYQIGKAWWGNGYCAEALVELANYAFDTVGLNRLWGGYDPRNPASGRVMEKAGFKYEGTLRHHRLRRGELVDRIIYGMIRPDRA